MSNNLSLSAMQLKTTKAKGLKTTSSNVVETLEGNSIEVMLGETYWSTSSMTRSSDGMGNTKQIVYTTNEGKVHTVNPATGLGRTRTLLSGEVAIPACKALYNDYDYGITRIDESELAIFNSSGSGWINLYNPFSSDAVIDAIAYRCPSAGAVSAAMITTSEGDSALSYGVYPTHATLTADCTKEIGSVQMLFVNETHVAIVELKTDGNIILTRRPFGLSSVEVFSMTTTGLTGKICDPFATNPVFYGYKADGLYSVSGTSAPAKVVNTSGITGIAVFTKYSSSCESGYIYREAGGDCRDATGKRTDPVVGTMVNDYNFVLYKIQAPITTLEEDPNITR